MNWRVPRFYRSRTHPTLPGRLWIVAVLFFGIGDLVTTGIGYSLPGVTELSPVVAMLLEAHALSWLALLKAAVLVLFYGLWRTTPSPHSLGIPLGLSVLGVLVTVWNTGVILASVLG